MTTLDNPIPCSVPSCDREARSRGWCMSHYARWHRTGKVAKTPIATVVRDLRERFHLKFEQKEPGECWPWIGELNNMGYGVFYLYEGNRRVKKYAHRMVFVLQGRDLTRSDVVMHACDNPRCVNPQHLSVGTQTDNMRDAKRKGRLNLSGLELAPTRQQRRSA